MTPTEQQILALLERRQHDPTETYRWLIEAVELLLRTQLELLRRPTGYSPPDRPWWDSTRPPDKP